MNNYLPERQLQNKKYTLDEIYKAIENKEMIHGKVSKCDKDCKLTVELGDNILGYINVDELEAIKLNNIKASATSKVGKRIQFIPIDIVEENGKYIVNCSRKQSQQRCLDEYVSNLRVGDVIPAQALKYDTFGIFCDIGCGIVAILPTGRIRVPHVVNPLKENKILKSMNVAVYKIDTDGRITLTHKELLGTWDDEVSKFDKNDVILGEIVSEHDFGYFVMVSQNLCGLANANDELDLHVGDTVSVKVLHINKETKKLKLKVIEKVEHQRIFDSYKYYISDGHISDWKYSDNSTNHTEFDS